MRKQNLVLTSLILLILNYFITSLLNLWFINPFISPFLLSPLLISILTNEQINIVQVIKNYSSKRVVATYFILLFSGFVGLAGSLIIVLAIGVHPDQAFPHSLSTLPGYLISFIFFSKRLFYIATSHQGSPLSPKHMLLVFVTILATLLFDNINYFLDSYENSITKLIAFASYYTHYILLFLIIKDANTPEKIILGKQ